MTNNIAIKFDAKRKKRKGYQKKESKGTKKHFDRVGWGEGENGRRDIEEKRSRKSGMLEMRSVEG